MRFGDQGRLSPEAETVLTPPREPINLLGEHPDLRHRPSDATLPAIEIQKSAKGVAPEKEVPPSSK
jgi:hypothetical protein